MAIKKIIYQNKVGIVPKTVQINQVWDDDMNEIKDVVNTNADQTTLNTNNIAAIMTNPVAAINVSATPSLVYLIGTNVQSQLNQTETGLVSNFKLDKEEAKNLYQTGLNRVDIENSVLTIIPTDTLRVTNCNNIIFVNEIAIDSNSNKVPDYVKSFGTVDFIANATNTPLTAGTRGVFYCGVNRLGTQVYRTAKIYDQDVHYIARIIVENLAGVYTVISFKYFPDLANNRMNRKDRFVQQSGYLVPSGAASISFGNRAMSFYKNSINYSNNKFDPNFLTLNDSVNPTPMQFLFVLPNITSLAVSIATSTVIDPTKWYDATGAVGSGGVASSNYQVYRVLLTVTGTILIQTKASTSNSPAPGVNAIFGSREDALAGLDTVVFPEMLPAGDAIVLGTFYLRAGTNPNGSQLNLANDFFFKQLFTSTSSSTVGATTHDTLSGKNDNPAFQHVTTTDIANWNNAYTNRITSLTTTGTSGAATLVGNVLNIPVYAPQSGSANYIQNQAASAQTASFWISGNGRFDGNVIGGAIIKSGGTATQFLKADGSLDNTSYAPATGGTGYIQNQFVSAQAANMWINGASRLTSIKAVGRIYSTSEVAFDDLVSTAGSTIMWYDTVLQEGFIGARNYSLASDRPMTVSGSKIMLMGGNVGIGTTVPLSITQINKAGQTIGTTTPSGALLISDDISTVRALELGVDTGNAISYIQARSLNSTATFNLALNPSGGNVLIGTTSDNGIDRLQVAGSIRSVTGGLIVNSTGASGTAASPFYEPLVRYSSSTGSGIYGGNRFAESAGTYLQFRVNDNPANSQINAMTIIYNGNVGIGTTNPSSKLEVNSGDIKITQTIGLPLTAGNGVTFRNVFNSNNYDAQIVAITNIGGAASSGLLFRTGYFNGSIPTQADRMYIDAETGNVGIGTTNPYGKINAVGSFVSSTNDFIQGSAGSVIYISVGNTVGNTFGKIQVGINGDNGTFGNLTLNALGGNVLIGTTTDSGHRLRVAGQGYFHNGISVGAISSSPFSSSSWIQADNDSTGIFITNNSISKYIGLKVDGTFVTSGSEIINGNSQITGLSGTGTRTVVADASGNLSATVAAPTSGVYAPTSSVQSNITAPIFGFASYIRVGNIVHVSMSLSGSITNTNTLTFFRVSLPIAKTATNNSWSIGQINASYSGANLSGTVDTTNSTTEVVVSFNSGSISGLGVQNVQFMYDVTQ